MQLYLYVTCTAAYLLKAVQSLSDYNSITVFVFKLVAFSG